VNAPTDLTHRAIGASYGHGLRHSSGVDRTRAYERVDERGAAIAAGWSSMGSMKVLVRGFVNGLLILVPLVVTGYVVFFIVTTIDGLIDVGVRGVGLLITLVGITLFGLFASNVVGRRFLSLIESGISRLPLVKLLYNSLKDLIGAFVGDKKSFDRPVLVEVDPVHGTKVMGFVTCSRFDDPQLAGHVAVYLPQSYNFAGNLLIVKQERVRPIDADGAQFMAFIVAGGVVEMNAAKTVVDGSTPYKPR
jgi:uncharacterized membrane protein